MLRTQQIASFSIVLGIGVLALKSGAWWLTHSAALFSDALESTVNVTGSLVALMALRYADRPADASHPYGHEKAEFFAAVIEGVMIIVAAFAILQHAWDTWQGDAQTVALPWQALALNGLATVLNGVWGAVLLRAGHKARSATLEADGRHLFSDVLTSIAILAGLWAAKLTGQRLIDPALAALVSFYVLWSGTSIIRSSVSGLMDAAPSAEVVERIRRLVGEHADGAIEAHDLKTRHAGRQTYLEFHLVVPGALSVSQAHEICDRIEAALREEMQHLIVTIHVEPDNKAKHHGVLVL